MEKELWRINRYLNLDRKHTLIPNVSFAFEFKNEIMTSLYVECINDKEGGAILSYGDSQMQLTLGKVSNNLQHYNSQLSHFLPNCYKVFQRFSLISTH